MDNYIIFVKGAIQNSLQTEVKAKRKNSFDSGEKKEAKVLKNSNLKQKSPVFLYDLGEHSVLREYKACKQ